MVNLDLYFLLEEDIANIVIVLGIHFTQSLWIYILGNQQTFCIV